MPYFTIPFDMVESLSQRDVAYQIQPEKFEKFYSFSPDITGLKKALVSRSDFPVDRDLLVGELERQYRNVSPTESQKVNIEALGQDDVFTVITAHQPSLFTGPLYFVTKIISTISLAKHLQEVIGKRIIPVFIVGSEDHDFEEVNHCVLYGKKIEWNSEQTGSVGRMTVHNLHGTLMDFFEILGDSERAESVKYILNSSIEEAVTYNDFVFKLVNHLFGKYGVVVTNMDSRSFKQAFIPYMRKELFESPSEQLIVETQKELESLGYHGQAHAREINLFYLTDGARNRIVYENGRYSVLETGLSWDKEDLMKELEINPQNFSPNVVMRPLYQEIIWPNLAYIGGGGELAYWLERKTQFEKFDVFFPALIRRNSLMIINASQKKQWTELGFQLKDLLLPEYILINQYLQDSTSFDINLDEEIKVISDTLSDITEKAGLADKSLKAFSEAEHTRILKQLQNIESRIKRSLKKKEETSVSKIKKLKSQLFPNLGLQERHDNYFHHYLSHGDVLINDLLEILNPLEKGFVIYYPE
jgi:bacillithiol biosynthesis cysteine-adding enzyme BshC